VTVEYFEGPAGSGKTYRLIERVRQLVNADFLAEGQRVLAITFMNGARRRLESSLGKHRELARRFECKTVDAFAQTLVARRSSLLAASGIEAPAAAQTNPFDPKCFLAAHLLSSACVAKWVAASYPLVLIDEAQDLDAYRLPILQGLASSCRVLAAADEFQCLDDGIDASSVIAWLESHGNTTRLDGSRRTTQSGILKAAHTVRKGNDLRAILTKHRKYEIWQAPGFKLMELPHKDALLARAVSNELRHCDTGNVAILTPNTVDKTLRRALEIVCTRSWPYNKDNPEVTFGPYAVEWDTNEGERAQALCKKLELPEMCSLQHLTGEAEAHSDPALVRVRARMERASRITGERTFSNARIVEMIGDAVREISRFGGRRGPRRAAMSIHRAKNMEFRNVVVLWPYGVSGSDEHFRRLLYNAITRAQQKCVVIALGKDRLIAAPFAPSASQQAAEAVRKLRRAGKGRGRKAVASKVGESTS
jgi:UvrD-like helicase C-terminal domain/AAA domain